MVVDKLGCFGGGFVLARATTGIVGRDPELAKLLPYDTEVALVPIDNARYPRKFLIFCYQYEIKEIFVKISVRNVLAST